MNKELMLDTGNLESIKKCLEIYPISGVTTNPTILRKEGNVDFFYRLEAIEKLLPEGNSLHVQVTALTAEAMVKEAQTLVKTLGAKVFVKVPVSGEGMKAIKVLVSEGINVTATAIYSSFQGMMAAMAGARYLAVYYNRMENIGVNPLSIIKDLSSFLQGNECKILAASFHNVRQLTDAYANGACACTVSPDILDIGMHNASIEDAVEVFHKDWNCIHGNNSITELL